MNDALHATPWCVYQRTTKGQAAALSGDCTTLDLTQQRLLLMVNGFTPMEVLARMARMSSDALQTAARLESDGLIERVGVKA